MSGRIQKHPCDMSKSQQKAIAEDVAFSLGPSQAARNPNDSYVLAAHKCASKNGTDWCMVPPFLVSEMVLLFFVWQSRIYRAGFFVERKLIGAYADMVADNGQSSYHYEKVKLAVKH